MRAAVEEALQDASREAPDPYGDGASISQGPLPPMPDLPPVYDFAEPAADLVPEAAPEPFPGPSDATQAGSARELIDTWVRGASDGADEGVRRAIVERLLASARSETLDCSADLTDRSQAYAHAEADAQAARTAIARTQETLAAARGARAGRSPRRRGRGGVPRRDRARLVHGAGRTGRGRARRGRGRRAAAPPRARGGRAGGRGGSAG